MRVCRVVALLRTKPTKRVGRMRQVNEGRGFDRSVVNGERFVRE